MTPEIAARLRAIDGDNASDDSVAVPAQLYLPYHEREPYAGVRVTRDIAYGDHPRQRLDLFESTAVAERGPIVLFAHGGGYVSGDRRLEWPVYYDNIGLWAARHGMAGAMMSYRLLPEAAWPSGMDDVGAAVAWLRTHRAAHHGDPGAIVLMGHSAGAAHVAAYLVHAAPPGILATILLSGTYDVGLDISPNRMAYFGSDPAQWAARSVVAGLSTTTVPLFLSCPELDSRRMQRQTQNLMNAIAAARGRPVPSVCLPGHTHWSQLFTINAAGVESTFADLLRDFIAGARTRQHADG